MFSRSNNDRTAAMMSRPMSRRTLLKGSLTMGAGALALGALGSTPGGRFMLLNVPSVAAAQLDTDIDILNYALTLEYLEADAYAAINDAGILSGRAATYFTAFGGHEAEHVAAITQTIQALGGTPVTKPAFDFSGVPTEPAAVVEFFQQVEAVGASAYHGAAPSVQNADVLAAALSIHANEAMHAAALADLVAPGTTLFSPAAFATPRTPDEVLTIVGPWLPSGGGAAPGAPATGGGGMALRQQRGGQLDVR